MTAEWRGWRAGLGYLAGSVGQSLDEAVNEDRIRLAVTGLSRAGKTLFITSLVQNLLALGAGRNTLPQLSRRLTEMGENLLLDVSVLPTGTSTLPYFDHARNLADLAADRPAWPRRTQALAGISLALTVSRRSAPARDERGLPCLHCRSPA
jgi:predicted YcjX-like family ATPase